MSSKVHSSIHGQVGKNSSEKAELSAIDTSVAAVSGVAPDLGLEPAVGSEARKSLAGDAALPATFIALSIDVAAEHAALLGEHFDAVKVEEAQAFLKSIAPLRNAVGVLFRQIEDSVLRKKAVLGSESRKLYRFMQVLPDTSQASTIEDALDRMTKAMKRPRRKKATPAPQPAEAPAVPEPVKS